MLDIIWARYGAKSKEMKWIFAVTIPLLSIVVFGIMLISIPLYKKVQSKLDAVLGITRENLSGVRVIRAFHRETEEKERFEEGNDALSVSVSKATSVESSGGTIIQSRAILYSNNATDLIDLVNQLGADNITHETNIETN